MNIPIKISTIIPCYNAEDYLERTVKLLEDQTYKNFEVIIIDDGSTDNTLAIAERLCSNRNNYSVHSYKNGGIAEARNRGLNWAKGDYIHFLDADDYFYPTMYEKMVKMIYNNDKPDAVRVNYIWYFDPNNIPPLKECGNDIVIQNDNDFIHLAQKTVGISEQDIQDYYIKGTLNMHSDFVPVWNLLIKHSFLKDHNIKFFKAMQLGEDRMFNLVLFAHAKKYVYTNTIYYLYLNTKKGLLTKMTKNILHLYEGKLRLCKERNNIRKLYLSKKGIDLFPYFRGSDILACLQLACCLVRLPYKNGNKLFSSFVAQPIIKESLHGFSTKDAPMKMKIPIFMLQHKMSKLLYLTIWIANKFGINFQQL